VKIWLKSLNVLKKSLTTSTNSLKLDEKRAEANTFLTLPEFERNPRKFSFLKVAQKP